MTGFRSLRRPAGCRHGHHGCREADAARNTRGVEAGHVLLETEDGVVRIALETIDGGHLLYDFDDDLLA